jgi:ornithine cyclodeaminase
MSLLLLTEDELRQAITISETLEVVKSALVALAENRIDIPGDLNLQLSEVGGDVAVKGAYLQETPYYVIKINNDFKHNPKINLPRKSGVLVVFDAATGFPAAVIADNGYLASFRSGVVGAVAADYLANPASGRVAIIGSGDQAYIQLKALMAVRKINLALVWGRSPLNVDEYARRMVEDHDLNIQIAPSVKEAVQQADIVITATASQTPLIKADWLKPGVHVTAVGSNRPLKQELEVEVLKQAEVIVADNLQQGIKLGEIHHGLQTGAITLKHIQGELAALVAGKIPGRTRADQITLADLTGLEALDAVVATLAMEKALYLGVGQRLELGLSQRALG